MSGLCLAYTLHNELNVAKLLDDGLKAPTEASHEVCESLAKGEPNRSKLPGLFFQTRDANSSKKKSAVVCTLKYTGRLVTEANNRG